MKKQSQILYILLLLPAIVFSQESGYQKAMERTEWWRSDRFGMFIHWGAYSVAARGEWVKSVEGMTTEAYQKYVDAFVPAFYEPQKWAKMAKDAGMKYAVMTAKHHDGFCLFDTELTDYKAGTNNDGRDFVREYVDAFREQGLKVGLYYSLIDWHHPEYPLVGNHPQADPDRDAAPTDWDAYLQYMHGQVEELMTNYGKIDILWLDYSFGEYADEKWKASELIEMIRSYQPDIIINNRLTRNSGVSSKDRSFSGYGDFETPEQGIPEKGLTDGAGNPIPWETCLTMNNNWGYSSNDDEWKSKEQLVHALVNCVSKNGNLLLNIGPDGNGVVPEPARELLSEVGDWMDKNGESIYGCGSSSMPQGDWGFATEKTGVAYAHWTYPTIGHINIKDWEAKVGKVTVLSTGKTAATQTAWFGNQEEGNFFINLEKPTYKTYRLPDPVNTVFRLELRE